jgi:OOP family OmpA-OmpF porin
MKFKSQLLMMTVLASVAACSSRPVVVDFPPSAIPGEEIANLERGVKAGQENQLDVLSPKNFKEARESLEDAQKSYSKGVDPQDTLHKVAEGSAYLAMANSVADVARSNIEDVVAARQAAVAAGAAGYYTKELAKIDDDLIDVTRDIEQNDLKDAQKERSELQAAYLDLEVKSIREANLKESRKTIELAIKEGAKKYAPRTLAEAQKSYKDSEAFILANRNSTTSIGARSAETKVVADKLLRINRAAKGSDNVASEEMALTLEDQQMARTEAESELATREVQLRETQGELMTTEAALTDEANTNLALTNSNQNLMSDKEFNEKYEAARREFNSNEAEVYKQGSKLVIRLKGLEFASSKANITDKNRPILEKVDRVLASFGTSNVMVEGHTDSVGGKTINQKVSSQRAEAVKDYLATKIGEPGKIEAVGYDYQRPLATNKTSKGRAQNRRVDIVITPERTNQ